VLTSIKILPSIAADYEYFKILQQQKNYTLQGICHNEQNGAFPVFVFHDDVYFIHYGKLQALYR